MICELWFYNEVFKYILYGELYGNDFKVFINFVYFFLVLVFNVKCIL